MRFFKKENDPFEKKISIEEAREEYNESFEIRWRSALGAFLEEREDAMYLLGPSSYLFSLDGIKIAVDPQVRRASDLEKIKDTVVPFFSKLSAVLVTHEHDDHFDTKLTNLLKDEALIWYLPHDMGKRWIEESGLRKESIRFVSPGDTFEIGSVKVRAFDTPHRPFGADWDLPERGYELTARGGRILLPGDIREYAYEEYPAMQGADLCVAHVWAGNNTIDPAEYLPRMECAADRFATTFAAKKYFLCHLYEIGRQQHVMWDAEHAEILAKKITDRLPEAEAIMPILGRGYRLFSCEEIK